MDILEYSQEYSREYSSVLNVESHMKIGVPTEIKTAENRVSMTPHGAAELTKRGHRVYV